jgi:hypothetical protein
MENQYVAVVKSWKVDDRWDQSKLILRLFWILIPLGEEKSELGNYFISFFLVS